MFLTIKIYWLYFIVPQSFRNGKY